MADLPSVKVLDSGCVGDKVIRPKPDMKMFEVQRNNMRAVLGVSDNPAELPYFGFLMNTESCVAR